MSEQRIISKQRIPSIDRFRGIVIFSMIFFQFIEHFKNLGALTHISEHSPNENAIYIMPNLAIADIVAPMFILAIGLTYIPSLRKRTEKYGKKAAVLHCVKRYLCLIGIGIAMDGVNDLLDGKKEPLNIMFEVVACAILVTAILSLILKLAKVGLYKKVLAFLGYITALAGVIGIVVALVNFIMLVTGKTDESFGHWVVLQHIGFAGLLALPFAIIDTKHKTLFRFAGGSALLLIYGLFHEGNISTDLFSSNLELIDKVADGGFIGGFAWAAMLVFYLAFSDIYYKSAKKFYISVGIFTIPVAALILAVIKTLPAETNGAAGALSTFLPINKGSVSPSYVLICILLSLIAFAIFDIFNFYKLSFDPLSWWGKNPILMYCIEFAFIGGLEAALGDFFEKASVPVSIVIIIAVTSILTGVAYILNKKKIIIKL